MQADCICTGVVLIEDDVAYNGDLFQMGDIYIVNCNTQSAHDPSAYDDTHLTITLLGNYWTRHGVYVIPPDEEVKLSPALNKYIGN